MEFSWYKNCDTEISKITHNNGVRIPSRLFNYIILGKEKFLQKGVLLGLEFSVVSFSALPKTPGLAS